MKKVILILFCAFSCAPSRNIHEDFSGEFKNVNSKFVFNQDGTFLFEDKLVYNSDVITEFWNGWSKGTWRKEKNVIYLKSNLENLINISIKNNHLISTQNINIINLNFNQFKKDFELYLVNENNSEIKIDLFSNTFKLKKGKYYFKLIPIRERLSGGMMIYNESFNSDSFNIESNNSEYSISINFPYEIFSFLDFSNKFLIIKGKNIIYNSKKFKK